ncbi:MAG: cytochrome c [Planctomycetota bacterium]|nr:MAG: cytochrome c [Planctomycetota bacterium]
MLPRRWLVLGAAALAGAAWLAVGQEGALLPGDSGRGRAVFLGRGRCAECHRFRDEGSWARGPSLDAHWADGPPLSQRLAQRPQPAGEYLLQSLIDPDAYLVPGYDAGMPSAGGPLLRLSRQDVADLLAYLGPDLPQPAVPAQAAARPDPWDDLPGGDARHGEDLFFRPDDAACSGCHIVRLPRLEARYHPPFWRESGLSGPELTRIALVREPAQVLEAILRPGAARTGGYRDVLVETQGGRLLTGLLLADGAPGLLLMDANPSGPYFRWLDRDSVAEVTPVARSRMTHLFTELLSVQERLDILAFLRQSARAAEGPASDALDPVRPLYTGRWPEDARPELLRRIPGVLVVE